MPIPFNPIPPTEKPDGSRFCDPIWQRWLTSFSNSLGLLLKQYFPSSGGTISGDVTITTNLTVQNNATVTHTITAQAYVTTSDERLKKGWRRLRPDLVEQLAGLKKKNRSGTFSWIAEGGRAGGISAQEVKKFLPVVVQKGSDGLHRVDYGVLGVLSAVELADRLLRAEAHLRELEDRLGQSEWREGRR